MATEREATVEHVCQSALDCEPSARAAFVHDACRGDAALEQEVLALLTHATRAERFLATPVRVSASDASSPRLSIGQRLGPYEIIETLGAGGMGEVYKARDTRLDRIVAIKVLREHLANDPDRRARFEREARAISKLSHPNICTLFDVGHDAGIDYLVVEYLEGQTLAGRLQKDPLPVDQALVVAIEIAAALDAAHRAGVIHRDLKPANVMLTKTGVRSTGASQAKLLDFSIARMTTSAQTVSITGATTGVLTTEGALVGTPQYMAPEQIEGRPADGRSDIFAFGALLYEMLTGTRAFAGGTQASLIAAVLEHEPPPLSSRLPSLPRALDRLVRKCLAKDPDRRWQSAADLADELQWIQTPDAGVTAQAGSRIQLRRVVATAGAAVVVVLTLAGLAWLRSRVDESPGVVRNTIAVSADKAVTLGAVAISPQGDTIVYTANSPQTPSRLFIRHLNEWEAHPVPGSEGVFYPTFSPDGRWIAFPGSGGLMKVATDGTGGLQVVAKNVFSIDFGGPRWQSGGSILYGSFGSGIWRVANDGSSPQLVIPSPTGTGIRYLWPEDLPSGGMLFTIWRDGGVSVAVQMKGDAAPRVLIQDGGNAHYLPTGHLLYESGDARLYAVAFDEKTLTVRGAATALADDVTHNYSVSANGTLVYFPESSLALNVVWKDRRGISTPLQTERHRYGVPSLSPDGRRFSVAIGDGPARTLWVGDVGGGPLTRLTPGNDDWYGVWSRDSKRALYMSGQQGRHNVFSVSADGGEAPHRLTEGPNAQAATSVAPDGDLFLYDEIDSKTGLDIWQYSMSRKEAKPIVKAPFGEAFGGAFSPDGRAIAYVSTESGRPEVYVQAYPGPGGKKRVSADGGTSPAWSHSGRELFYQTSTAMYSVPILDAQDLRVGPAARLFTHKGFATQYAYVGADDQRFLGVEQAENTREPQISVVQHWFEEVKQRVPAK